MELYLFILGRDPELSKKELLAYLQTRNISCTIVESSDIALIIETSTLHVETMIKELGGIQKIVKVLPSVDNVYTGTENKVRYAISRYTDEEDTEIKVALKDYFRREKIRAVIKKPQQGFPFLSPTEARGVVEIVLYKQYMGKTVAVFDPREHKTRDIQRPVQRVPDAISIRLAKILINLAGAKSGETLLDPFCGIGTILQEAMLMGINTIGIDNDPSSIEATKKNLEWIRNTYHPKGTYKVLKGNARALFSLVKKADCVVTEPDLGPYLRRLPTGAEAQRIVRELQPLYTQMFQELQKLKPRTVVIIIPRFETRAKKTYLLSIESVLQRYGFTYEEPIPYQSPTSKILRDIWILHKA
ncbi:MAG TPA: DNA methyltransferase [Candidatus Nanoarchaeia archaeon]|nr:DNA methyltransferase [Candidatus Nanoarchaeia archaeon]